MAFLSVIIPVYNGEELIEECISSVLNQPCRDLELIVLDDGSLDGTSDICRQMFARDERIQLISHTNVGLGANRNLGFKYCTGEWIIFLDHDDLIVDGFYTENMKRMLQEFKRLNIGLVVPSRLMANSTCDKAYFDCVKDLGVAMGASEVSWEISHEFASCIYLRDVLEKNSLRFEETRPEMETVFRHKAAFLSENVFFAPELYFSVRRNSESQITRNWDKKIVSAVRLRSYLNLLEWHLERHDGHVGMIELTSQKVVQVFHEYVIANFGQRIPVDLTMQIEHAWQQKLPSYIEKYLYASNNSKEFSLAILSLFSAFMVLPNKVVSRFIHRWNMLFSKEIKAYSIRNEEQDHVLLKIAMQLKECK